MISRESELDPLLFSLIAASIVCLAVVYLKGRLRYVVAGGILLLPTLAFAVWDLGYWIWHGFDIKADDPNRWGFFAGMVMVPVFNLLWAVPSVVGGLIGWLILLLRKKTF